MAVAMSLDRRRHDRAEQLEHLRRKIAAVSGKVGDGRRGPAQSIDPLVAPESLLPLPESQAELSPAGGETPHPTLPRGTVAVLSGARSLSLRAYRCCFFIPVSHNCSYSQAALLRVSLFAGQHLIRRPNYQHNSILAWRGSRWAFF